MKTEGKNSYNVKTYCFRLYQKHMPRLEQTKELYGRVVTFFAQCLVEHQELLNASNQTVLRQLEIAVLGEKRKGIPPKWDFPFAEQKIPLYFRRAATNEAIAFARSNLSRQTKIDGVKMKQVEANPVFYQGMYRNFQEDRLELKLYDGTQWSWSSYRFSKCGRTIPANAELLSPCVVLKGGQAYLHVPVRQLVTQVVSEGTDMAVACPMGDVFAACVFYDTQGKEAGVHCIRGGKQLKHEREALEKKLKELKIRQAEQNQKKEMQTGCNLEDCSKQEARYREKLMQLGDGYAHQVSSELVKLAAEHRCRTITVPDYNGKLVLNRLGNRRLSPYDWIGRRIVNYLEYKAEAQGIKVHRVFAKDISSICSICGANVKRYGETSAQETAGKPLCVCENGHKALAALNTARNVHHRYLETEK